jgi:hypothetical protein
MTDGVRLGFRDDTPFFGDATFGFFRFRPRFRFLVRVRTHGRPTTRRRMGGRVRGAEATTTTTTTTNGTDENEEGKTRNGQRGMDGPPARGGFASTTSVDDDWRGVGDNRKDNQTVDEENERGGEDAEMLDEDDEDDDEDDASDVRFMDRGVGEASTPRHADGTFGFQSFQSLIFAREGGCLLKSRIATRRFPARRDEETDEETNERGAVSTRPLSFVLHRRPVLDLPRRRYRGTRGTYTMRCERQTATTETTREPDGTEPNGRRSTMKRMEMSREGTPAFFARLGCIILIGSVSLFDGSRPQNTHWPVFELFLKKAPSTWENQKYPEIDFASILPRFFLKDERVPG